MSPTIRAMCARTYRAICGWRTLRPPANTDTLIPWVFLSDRLCFLFSGPHDQVSFWDTTKYDFFFANYTQINNIILEFSRENTCRVFFYSRLYCCPWVVFSQSVALKIKNPQKQKSKRFNFALAFDLFVLKMGIEPTLQRNWILNPARLPIPPLEH